MIVTVLAVVAGIVAAFVVAGIVSAIVRSAGRRSAVAADLSRRARRPLRAVLVVVAVWVAVVVTTDASDAWVPPVQHALQIALIACVAWLIGALAFVAEDIALARYRIDVPDNRHARRVRTQVTVLRRVTVAVLVVAAVAAILMTFEAARAFGTGLLASAGLLSIVAGLAAQSSLANLFAGLQLAFTDAIRVDDVVVVDDEWGRIEEITLTYIVVHVWDDRRLILPSTYFTTTPFENWTRRAADLLGTVELDLDWSVPVEDMRAELARLLEDTELWDHRVGILQVTEATGGYVRVRALASAVDAPTLFDLRCYVREGLVAWLQSTAPHGVPRTRLETVQDVPGARGGSTTASPGRRSGHPAVAAPPQGQPGDTQRLQLTQTDARLFTGSIDALERSRAFSGPGSDVIAEREQAADARTDSRGTPRVSGPVTVVGPPLPEPQPADAHDGDGDGTRDAAAARQGAAGQDAWFDGDAGRAHDAEGDRARDADRARAEAERARAESERARRDAERARVEAEGAREAERARRDAERAAERDRARGGAGHPDRGADPYADPDARTTTVMRPTPGEPTRAPSRTSVLPVEPDASGWRATWNLPGSEQLTGLPGRGDGPAAPERTSAFPRESAAGRPAEPSASQPPSPPLGTRRQRQAQADETAVLGADDVQGYGESRRRGTGRDEGTDGPPTARYDWRGGE
ncbi:mechanosensitive ion channel domain-containing protein [Cellulomonas sp. NS3]|uniref:mechanosensitive ion channel domain-containing protein n=1 Tax=Cellulomonas sp. NS3 TaxID=2973977 RepID=UPI002867EA1D|nr:mechanosensitive ion channel domain-containing protein [Cellulomonas sp. NS3]